MPIGSISAHNINQHFLLGAGVNIIVLWNTISVDAN